MILFLVVTEFMRAPSTMRPASVSSALVADQLGIADKGPGNGDALTLPAGELGAARATEAVEAVREGADKVPRAGGATSCRNGGIVDGYRSLRTLTNTLVDVHGNFVPDVSWK